MQRLLLYAIVLLRGRAQCGCARSSISVLFLHSSEGVCSSRLLIILLLQVYWLIHICDHRANLVGSGPIVEDLGERLLISEGHQIL